jgi:hypothetical protein
MPYALPARATAKSSSGSLTRQTAQGGEVTIFSYVLLAITLIGYFPIQLAKADKEPVSPRAFWAYIAVSLATIACFVIPRS